MQINGKIIFEVKEDIFYLNSKQNLFKINHIDEIKLNKNRNLLSYCYEFCGKYDVEFNFFKFKIPNKEIDFKRIIKNSIIVHVYDSSNKTKESYQLKDCLFKLENENYFYDLILKIDTKEIKVHKCILSCRSLKFKKMIDFIEKKDNKCEKIILTNININSLYFILDWIYMGEINININYKQLLELIFISEEYILKDLKSICEENIIYNLDNENILDILITSYKYKNLISKEVLENSINYLLENFDKILLKTYNILEKLIYENKGLFTYILLFNNKKKNKFKKWSFLSKMLSRDSSKDENFFN